jgi:hypothetical protein
MRLISDSSECYFLDNRCEWPIKSCDLPVMSAQHRQSRKASRKIAAPRQDFALNLSAKRCLCNTVGGRIGRIVEGCAAYRCAVTAARSRALTMTNFARSSLALVLRAFFGGAKSCALVNFFMICPPVGWWLADHDQILPPDPGYLMALGTPPGKRVPSQRRKAMTRRTALPRRPPGGLHRTRLTNQSLLFC